MTSVAIGDQRSEIVDYWSRCLSLCHRLSSSPALFAIVEQLGSEELSNLVGDGI